MPSKPSSTVSFSRASEHQGNEPVRVQCFMSKGNSRTEKPGCVSGYKILGLINLARDIPPLRVMRRDRVKVKG